MVARTLSAWEIFLYEYSHSKKTEHLSYYLLAEINY